MAKNKSDVNAKVITICDNPNISVESRILFIRNRQVIMDRDIADLYEVETRTLNQSVKRNIDRFPERYRFQLTREELEKVITNCDYLSSLKFSPSLPFAFTEEGVAMLSSVLRSPIATSVSIKIMDAFVSMRRFFTANAGIFQRLEAVEMKQLQTDKKIDAVMDRLDDGSLKPKLGIFFDGQMFDANVLVEQLTSVAKNRIVLIDDYVTAEILQRFHRCSPKATIVCYVKDRFKTSALEKVFSDFSAQYPSKRCELHTSDKSHDRWLIVDDDVYHFGASVKDLGKRWFSVDKQTEYSADELVARL